MPPLRALVDAGHDIRLVVSRPDRRRGRGPATSPSPVKEAAIELGLPVTADLGEVTGCGAELGVVVAYGRIIPSAVLDQVPMMNLHFSLLPRWRGAAPVERALLAGDEWTGVCVMALEPTLDTGPVYAREAVPIGDDDLVALRDRLVAVGTRLLVETLSGGMDGLPMPEPQEGEPSYADKIDPSELRLDWTRPAGELVRVVRLGHAWTTFRGRRLLVRRAVVVGTPPSGGDVPPPGTIVGDQVVCGEGALALTEVQPEGRAAMAAVDWSHGARPGPGEQLG